MCLEFFSHGVLEVNIQVMLPIYTICEEKTLSEDSVNKKGVRSLGGNYLSFPSKHHWHDLCAYMIESTPPRTRRDPSRIPVWFPAFERHFCYGLLCEKASEEESRAAKISDVHLLGSPLGLRQNLKTSNVGHYCPLRMSGSFPASDPYSPWRNGGGVERNIEDQFPITGGLTQVCVSALTLPSCTSTP